MKRSFAWLLAIVMLFGSAFALAEPAEEFLTVGTTTAMSGSFMNNMFGSNTADIDVRNLLHGYSLTEWSAADGTYVFNKDAVSKVETKTVDGNIVYTLTLNSMKYSDGSEITAKDYAFSILLALAPETKTLGASAGVAEAILGSEAYAAGQTDTLKGVQADGSKLTITVDGSRNPDFYELSLLGFNPYPIAEIAPGCQVVSAEAGCAIENIEAGEDLFTAELLSTTLMDYVSTPETVSGPYTLTSYDAAGSVATFTANPYYGEDVKIEKITYKLVSNDEIVSMLESGDLDLINKVTKADVIDAAKALDDVSYKTYPRSGFSFVSFSCEQDAVASANVRKAIAHCFDKATFIADYVGSYGEAVDGYYGIGQWMVEEAGTSKLTKYGYDVEAAKALLEAEGWKLNDAGVRAKGDATLALTIVYPEGNEVGEFLTGSFAESLKQAGIALTAEAKPFAELLKDYYRQNEREADMIYLASNFGTVYDPAPAFEIGGVDNRTGVADEKLYQLAVSMRETQPGDKSAYAAKWADFQACWTELLPAIPVYSNIYYDFYTAELKGYHPADHQTWSQAIVGAELSK